MAVVLVDPLVRRSLNIVCLACWHEIQHNKNVMGMVNDEFSGIVQRSLQFWTCGSFDTKKAYFCCMWRSDALSVRSKSMVLSDRLYAKQCDNYGTNDPPTVFCAPGFSLFSTMDSRENLNDVQRRILAKT
jgi:hypothetical protein